MNYTTEDTVLILQRNEVQLSKAELFILHYFQKVTSFDGSQSLRTRPG
jgi:hypothetical protein